ncbi:MAG: hypothetical protein ACLFTG_07740 [Alphaproteobacteria bacterium]
MPDTFAKEPDVADGLAGSAAAVRRAVPGGTEVDPAAASRAMRLAKRAPGERPGASP